jgi:hypothetical protein
MFRNSVPVDYNKSTLDTFRKTDEGKELIACKADMFKKLRT